MAGPRPDRMPREDVAGDPRALFDETVLPHLDAAYTLARYLLRDEDDARDAVQDAFLRALTYFRSFRGDDARAWVMAIVRNTCHSHRQRRGRAALTTPFEDEAHSPVDEGDDAAVAPLIQQIPAGSVRDAVQRLPMEFREVVILREVHGYSYKEIGAIVGVPIGTVMSRLARARERLRVALDPRTRRGVSA